MRDLLWRLSRPSLDWLLILLPLALLLEVGHRQHAEWASPTWVFLAAAAAIVPVAGWMGRATEHLAARLGDGVGGLLNATFGNAAELIIAGIALLKAVRHPEQAAALHAIVKASITGSIIGNCLLVLGLALLVGGLRYPRQLFNTTATRASSTLMLLAATALVLPAALRGFAESEQIAVRDLSLELSIVLLAAYLASLVFALVTHRHLYGGGEHGSPHGESSSPEPWSLRRSFGVLLAATAAIALLAEVMIGSVNEASHALGLTDMFVGVIVVAIVGNAAEHSTAVLVAWHNRMDLSVGIAVGSSVQIALFIAPLLVLFSRFMGQPLDLAFSLPEVAAVAISVLVANQIAGDGESNWLEGALLMALYAMLGFFFFHYP